MRHALLGLAFVLTACGVTPEREPVQHGGTLTVSTAERGSLRHIDSEMLSRDAHITSLLPDGGRNGVAFTFRDPARRISAGLGVIDRQHDHARLVWPDSVTSVHWSTANLLAFTTTTGDGISATIDVAAAILEGIREIDGTVVTPSSSPDSASRAVTSRATAYIDSLRMQLPGASAHGALQYQVLRFLFAPTDSVAAFYVAAVDAAGTRFNPAWYVLDVLSQHAEPIDSLTARAADMPMEAAAWDGGHSFFYAKDGSLYEAHVVH